MKKAFIILNAVLLSLCSFAQEPADSIRVDSLDEVEVTAFGNVVKRTTIQCIPVTVKAVELATYFQKASLVPAMNTVPGVRMEERSPGSYRINIRGSSLRSPFGVRNVKVYWNEIPITDPGGNTYFNQFAINNFSSIEIYKGPASSMYGSGTGGLIWMRSIEGRRPNVEMEYGAGSYGMQNVYVTARPGKNNRSAITYAHNETDGYRQQSAMRRDNFSWVTSLKFSDKQELLASVLFTDMYYQTPGGLTKAEFTANPRAARPAAGAFPGAETAKAAIYQKNFLAGISNRYKIDSHWTNTTVLYAAFANIRNPAIRNYERRSEPHGGGRTTFAWNKKINSNSITIQAGGETQLGYFNTKVFGNKQGVSDTLQTDDDIKYNVYTLFLQGDLQLAEKWLLTAGGSVNRTQVDFTRLNKVPLQEQSATYGKEFAPRLTATRRFKDDLSVFVLVAKGFSPPGIAELLPSTGEISTDLKAETGVNYELGFNKRFANWRLNGSVYHFKLNNALVQRRDASGADYFINAGDAKQSGLDITADYTHYIADAWFSADVSYAYAHYRYGTFKKDTFDFSGKQIPSVPAHTVSARMSIKAQNGLYVNVAYYFASEIFLNDANTAAAEPYHLLGGRIGWDKTFKKKFRTHFYVGAENLLEEVYSLGNDINDARGRYYNTAAGRNYYAGIALQIFGR